LHRAKPLSHRLDMTRNIAPQPNADADELVLASDNDADAEDLLPSLIYRQLHQDIVSGVLASGKVLRQEELARRFRTSRVPLREALSRLEAEGLIELRPRRGYAVVELDAQAIVEIYELRMVIEEHAGAIAARARTPEDIADVEQLLIAMRKLDRASPNYAQEWTALNYRFHLRIIEASRRKRLLRIARNLRDSVEAYLAVDISMITSFEDADEEHTDIFEAFRAGDATGLAELCRKHVEDASRRLLKMVRARAIAAQSRER
jgi:DNA-binding GntR family transcriptional regulator